MAGTAAGQLVALLAAPVLSRLYDPHDFGVFSVVNAIAMVAGTAAALRYELAVPLPEDDDDARALVSLGLLAATVSSLVLLVLTAVLTPVLGELLSLGEHAPWLLAVPVLALTYASFQVLNQWALRQQRFLVTARRNVVQSVTTVVAQLLAGVRGGPGGLLGGVAVGQALGAAVLLPGSRLGRGMHRSRWRAVASRYRRFPTVLVPAGVINASGFYLPVIVVAATYGASAAGWLGFTQRILALPITLIGQATAQVYLSELARIRRERAGDELRLFASTSTMLAVVGTAIGLGILLLAPPLWTVVFGDQWRVSGLMAQALAVSLALQLLASPLSQTLVVFERTGVQLGWDSVRFVSVTLAVYLAWYAGLGVTAAVWALSLTSAACYLASWLLSRWTLARHT